MNHPDYTASAIAALPPAELNKAMAYLPADQICELIAILDAAHDNAWDKKICAAYEGLVDHDLLVAAASAMNTSQTLALLGQSNCPATQKLGPLFIGLSQEQFAAALLKANPHQLHVIQEAAMIEPLQHQLTTLLHELEQTEVSCRQKLFDLDSLIRTKEGKLDSRLILQQFDTIGSTLDKALATVNCALAIAWNSNRSDLIDRFSRLKEHFNHDSRMGLGHPRQGARLPTGLYGELEQRLAKVYGNLVDEDPATEAFGQLLLWYLKDYWEVGLLPEIELEQAVKGPHDERLKKLAVANLQRIGLTCLADIKSANIYSKADLITYVKDRTPNGQTQRAPS